METKISFVIFKIPSGIIVAKQVFQGTDKDFVDNLDLDSFVTGLIRKVIDFG